MNEAWLTPWATALAVVATALAVVVSALLERSSPIRLRHWAEKAGGRLLALYSAPKRFSAFRFLVSLLARLAPVALAWISWRLLDGRVAQAPWLALGVTAALLALLEWVNRFLVEHHAEDTLRRATPLLRALSTLLLPAVWVMSHAVTGAGEEEEEEDEDIASDDELEAYIDVGVREGILERDEEELVRGVVDFGDAQVRSVMTPRVEVVSCPVDTPLTDLAQRFFESKHARLPLYRESIDHIVGILHIRDLFEAIQRGEPADAAALSNAPLYVPESKPLSDLLEEMQALHQQMAIVVDEYGGVAGLVTVEDLVEEIVGDIADEHEPGAFEREKLDGSRWRLAGRTDLKDLEELFDLDSDELPYETVSGLICGELGYVPKPGHVAETHGLVFTVEKADERRVTTVTVERAPLEETA